MIPKGYLWRQCVVFMEMPGNGPLGNDTLNA
jgi:hypothetical protein